MFAVPRGDIASSFAVHRTRLCSKSCIENAFCKPESSSKREVHPNSWDSAVALTTAFLGLSPTSSGCHLHNPSLLGRHPGPTTARRGPGWPAEAAGANGMLSASHRVDIVIIVVGTERLTFGLLKMSLGLFSTSRGLWHRLRVFQVLCGSSCCCRNLSLTFSLLVTLEPRQPFCSWQFSHSSPDAGLAVSSETGRRCARTAASVPEGHGVWAAASPSAKTRLPQCGWGSAAAVRLGRLCSEFCGWLRG